MTFLNSATRLGQAEVEAWQRFLRTKGLYHGEITGFFDSDTEQATREYQEESGLEADGVVGRETLDRARHNGYIPDSGGPYYHKSDLSVDLSMEARSVLEKIADDYHRETGDTLVVNSGKRTPRGQAEAMFRNLQHGDRVRYEDQEGFGEIYEAYKNAMRSGSQARAVDDMTRAIEHRMSRGKYISRHLLGRAFDISDRGMTSAQEGAFINAVSKVVGHGPVHERGHFHVQF